MSPTLNNDQVVLVRKQSSAPIGSVVVMQHNGIEKIKRLVKRDQRGLYIVGDNPSQSTDSRAFGWLPVENFIGVVVWPRGLKRRA